MLVQSIFSLTAPFHIVLPTPNTLIKKGRGSKNITCFKRSTLEESLLPLTHYENSETCAHFQNGVRYSNGWRHCLSRLHQRFALYLGCC